MWTPRETALCPRVVTVPTWLLLLQSRFLRRSSRQPKAPRRGYHQRAPCGGVHHGSSLGPRGAPLRQLSARLRQLNGTFAETSTRERGPLTKEPATKAPAVVPAARPIALDACVTTPSSEVAHRIGGGSAASCPPRSGGNIRDPPPGVRRPPSPRTRPTHATSPDGIRTVEASQPPCAKSPTDSLGLTEPKSYLPLPPHGPTPIPARPVPAVQARKESRPLALDKDGSQQLEPPKAKPRGPSEPSGTRDPSAPACAPIMQSNTV